MKRRLILLDEPSSTSSKGGKRITRTTPAHDDNNPDVRRFKKVRRTSPAKGDHEQQEDIIPTSTSASTSSTSYTIETTSPPPPSSPSTPASTRNNSDESYHRIIHSLQGVVRQLRSQHKFTEARKIMEERLIPLLPMGSLQLMLSLTELGRLCFHDDDMDSSMSYHNAALNMYLDQQQNIHFAKLAIVNLRNVAAIYLRFGKCRESLLCYTFVYRIQTTTMSRTTTTTTTNNNNTNNSNNTNDEEEQQEIATTLSCIGLMHYLLGEFREALRYYKEELLLRIEHHNGNMEHEDIAVALNSIGIVYYRLDDITAARQSFQSCLQIRQRLLGLVEEDDNDNDNDNDKDAGDGTSRNPNTTTTTRTTRASGHNNHTHCFDLAMVYFNLAAIAMKQGDDKEASRLYRRSMELKKAVFGNHPEIAVDYQWLGQLFLDQGDSKTAIEYYTDAYKIVQGLMSSSSSNQHLQEQQQEQQQQSQAALRAAQKLLVIIGNIHLLEANIEGMMENFEKAARMGVVVGSSRRRSDDDDDTSSTTTTSFMQNVRVFGGCQLYSISRMHPPCAAEA